MNSAILSFKSATNGPYLVTTNIYFLEYRKKKSFLSLKQLALMWIPGISRFSKLVIVCDMTLNIGFK